MRKFCKDKLAMLGLLVIVLSVILSMFPELIARNDPVKVDLEHKLEAPSFAYPLGTDPLGRCIFSRLVFAVGNTTRAAFLILGLVMVISVVVGCTAGFIGGKIDRIIMRLIDALLAFPAIILAIVVAGILGPNLKNLILSLAAVCWASYARIIRGMVLSVKNREYILAARALGTTTPCIITRHVLPNILPQVLVLATTDMGSIILSIAGLSFLGLGVQPPQPELGVMINDAWAYFLTRPELVFYPGAVLVLLVVAFNVLGDGLRNILDVKTY